jgi:catechol 2,3-dioxygenase-like lactoylglutathione lyase family enzyme
MQLKKTIPIVLVDELAVLKDFYTRQLGFVVTFDSPGYLGLRHPENEACEIAFMLSERDQRPFAGGLFLGLEVADVDAEHERLQRCGVVIEKGPTDNPWGDRSFTIHDPAGVTLYICTPIAPTAEFQQYYKQRSG